MAQLHLAFASPVTSVKSQDEGKLAHQLGQFHELAFMVGQLDIGKLLTDLEIHTASFSEFSYSNLPRERHQ
jgi:hypothetical protein